MHRKHRYAAFEVLPSGILCVVWCVDHCACEVAGELAGGSSDGASFPGHVAALLPGAARQFVPREGASPNLCLCNVEYEESR